MIADIIAQDSEGRDVLIVEVKARPLSPNIDSQLIERMAQHRPSIPFVMVADVETIHVVRRGDDSDGTALVLKTADVLRTYDPEYDSVRIYHHYLETLIESWLRDFAYHWKSEVPPAARELDALGLVPRLEGGATVSEVPLGSDSLC